MNRAAAFFLSLVLLLSVLNACRREENLPAEPEEIPTEVVFESVELPCPADTSINYFIRPAADADAVYAVGTQSLADGNVPVLLRFPRDGSPADSVRIPCPEGAWVSLGLFADGKLFFLYSVSENGVSTRTLAEMPLVLADPAVTPLLCFGDLPPEGRDFNATLLARDADGLFYLFDYTGVMILDERQAFRGVFPLASYPSSAATLADGRVWACFREIGESRIACVDPESGNLTDPHPLGAGTQTLVSSGDCFGVCDGPAGLSALILDEEGHLTAEPLLDFVGVGYATAQDRELPTLHPSSLEEGQSLFLADAGRNAAGERGFLFVTKDGGNVLTLCTPREVPVSERREFVFAHAYPLSDTARTLLVRFGRENPDLRLTLLDYSQYATSDDPDAGSRRLTTDILTGLAAPDLIWDTVGDGRDENGTLTVLCRKGYYLPLDPYLAADGEINRDTLFGSIQTAFSDENGQMWGISPAFTVPVLKVKKEWRGALSAQPTLGEFLDWADAAPKDALIYQGCVREQIIEYGDPLVRDFSGFYDTKTAECSFDSPLFRRYLDWLASLPDEKALIAIRGEMSVVQFFLRQGFESGKLLLTDESLGGARSLGSFALAENQGTAFLDAPTSGGAGMEIRVGSAYLIPACAASPDLAWQYIRAALLSADSDPTDSLTPALKSAFSETLASYRGGRIAEGSDGSVFPLREGEDVSAGLKRTTTFRYSDLSDETIEETLAFFDRAAAPILEMTPDTVTSILTEEISACLSGVGTSEDCAAKIQSRVSIWLAENK